MRPQVVSPMRSSEPQLAERDRDLGVPPLRVDDRPALPHRVPVVVADAGVVGVLRVLHRAERVGGEVEAVAPVEEGVDDDRDPVALGEARVALHLAGDGCPSGRSRRPRRRSRSSGRRRGRGTRSARWTAPPGAARAGRSRPTPAPAPTPRRPGGRRSAAPGPAAARAAIARNVSGSILLMSSGVRSCIAAFCRPDPTAAGATRATRTSRRIAMVRPRVMRGTDYQGSAFVPTACRPGRSAASG